MKYILGFCGGIDDSDPKGEINIAVELANGSVIRPVIRCMKRYDAGAEESIYAYLYVLDESLTSDEDRIRET